MSLIVFICWIEITFHENMLKKGLNLSNLQTRSIIVTMLLIVFLMPLANSFESFWRVSFCLPSATISSIFLGSTYSSTDQGYMIANRILPIHVTKACSAANFFILLLSLIIGILIKSVRKNEFWKLFLAVILAYLITVIANSARIIAGWITGILAREFLPDKFWPAVHLGTGVFMFLIFLFLTYYLLTGRHYNGWIRKKADNS